MPFCPILSIKLFLWHVYNSPVFGNKNWEIGKKQTDGAREEGFVQLYFSSVLVRSLGTNIGKVEIEKKNKETEGPREEGFVQLFFSHARLIGGSIRVYAAHILLLRSMNNSSKIK